VRDLETFSGFWLGKYEVRQLEWRQVMSTEPWRRNKPQEGEGDDFPAIYVTWNSAMEFCRKLTEAERKSGRLLDGWEYTLPTEAQWERACRARTETPFSFGDDTLKLSEWAWFADNAMNRGEHYAHRVGQKNANPWGLCDMHGNVWEWCRDVYAERLPGGRDPELTDTASNRVFRGGGWNSFASSCRSMIRARASPSSHSDHIGFRVALVASGQPGANDK
jgi:formylglycine-generating enzyme required for sulfatase activity